MRLALAPAEVKDPEDKGEAGGEDPTREVGAVIEKDLSPTGLAKRWRQDAT
jgi:hypothetical protein